MNNDLISRSELKKVFGYTDEWYKGRTVCEYIDDAPTVVNEKLTSERPQGEWIAEYWEDAYQQYFHTCSICKKDIEKTCYDNFCPNCGAKMITDESQ